MTSIIAKSRRPDVTFYPDGHIDLTANVAKLLQLQSGDVIDIAQSGAEYLMYVRLRNADRIGRHVAQVYPTKKGKHRSNNFRCHSIGIYYVMQSILNSAKGPIRLNIGQPVTLTTYGPAIPLITAARPSPSPTALGGSPADSPSPSTTITEAPASGP